MARLRSVHLNVLDWLAVLPHLVTLFDSAWKALQDGKIDKAERERLADDLIALVAAAKGA